MGRKNTKKSGQVHPTLHYYTTILQNRNLTSNPGPDLAWQGAVMQSEASISSENTCISTSRRASRSRPGLGTGRAGQYSN